MQQVLAKLAIVAEQAPPSTRRRRSFIASMRKKETLAKYVKIFLKWFADAQETTAAGDCQQK